MEWPERTERGRAEGLGRPLNPSRSGGPGPPGLGLGGVAGPRAGFPRGPSAAFLSPTTSPIFGLFIYRLSRCLPSSIVGRRGSCAQASCPQGARDPVVGAADAKQAFGKMKSYWHL